MESEISNKSVHTEDANSLQIIAKGTQKLTKLQEQFNSLMKKIANLEKDIEKESEKMNSIHAVYSKNVSPLKHDIALTKIKLATELDEAFHNIKFAKKYDTDFELVIISLLNEAFYEVIPNKEQEELYDRWAQVSYKEELSYAEKSSKEMTSKFIKDMFNIDIDINNYENNPEGQAQFHRDVKEQINNKKTNTKHSFTTKSKKHEEKLLAQKAAEELKNRNIRSIYIALAKILHPDSETDETLKLEKEELMKKVTVAYEQKDLPTLLKLELEWVHKTTEHLETLNDEKLRTYISALKEQAKELEQEKMSIRMNPRFQDIYHLANYQESVILKELKTFKNKLVAQFEQLHTLTNSIRNNQDKKEIIPILTMLSEYYDFDESDPYND